MGEIRRGAGREGEEEREGREKEWGGGGVRKRGEGGWRIGRGEEEGEKERVRGAKGGRMRIEKWRRKEERRGK